MYSEMQFVFIVLSVNLFCDEHALHFLIETNFFMKLLCCLLIFEETLQIKVMQWNQNEKLHVTLDHKTVLSR